jgi:hypothetical protein
MRPSLVPIALTPLLCACASSWDQGWLRPGASRGWQRETSQ